MSAADVVSDAAADVVSDTAADVVSDTAVEAVSDAVTDTAAGIVRNLRTEYQSNPLGLDESHPRFSWQYVSAGNGEQTAYRITVARSLTALAEGELIWDSGKVDSEESHGIVYAGNTLEPTVRYYWDVSVWETGDAGEAVTRSGETSSFEMGLLDSGWSGAAFISPPAKETEKHSAEQTTYTIMYDILLNDSVASFVFGADTGKYDSFYLWEIGNTGEEQGFLRINSVDRNQTRELQYCSLASVFPDQSVMNDTLISVKIAVDGNSTITYIQDIPVAEQEIEACAAGRVGYLQKRGSAAAYLDNIRVEDGDGTLTIAEDFEAEDTIFSPYYYRTKDGMLEMRNGTFLSYREEDAAPMFRRDFLIPDKTIASARLYATALGIYDFRINGQMITEDLFNPGKLAYNSRLVYRTHDVTDWLSAGENVIGAVLGHGWYDRAVGYPDNWNPWGDRTALLAKLLIRYEDGTEQIVVTDEEWQVYENGPIRDDDIYHGEFYDANYEQEGWSEPDFGGSGWEKAAVNLISERYQDVPIKGRADSPIVCYDRLTPVSYEQIDEKTFVYDFGRNFSGVCNIQVSGEKGAIVRLRHGEAVNQETMRNKDDEVGTIWTANLLTAEATDTYVLKGEGTESYRPSLTYHGFRYLQIDLIGDGTEIEKVEGIALSSPIERTGTFQSSSPELNRLYETTVNGMWSNFFDNPTDCPQRDERHGWTGDAQVFARTASYHGDVYLFYDKFLRDMRDIQDEKGFYPNMAPRNFGTGWRGIGSAGLNGWGDAGVWITWQLYLQYGDKRIIEDNFAAMCRWMEQLEGISEDYICYLDGHGDHLSLENTPTEISDTAWCAYSAGLIAKMAAAIGKTAAAQQYEETARRFREAWQQRYLMNGFPLAGDAQTAYVVGLDFGLFRNEAEQDWAAAYLNQKIIAAGYHPTTGFIGEGRLLSVLSEHGYSDTAYALLMQQEYPSWQYPVLKGATTPSEWWNAYEEHEDGTFSWNSSLNHYARGAYASWFYTDILGIRPDEAAPGFKKIILRPRTGGGLRFAEGSYESVRGTIQCRWEITEEGYRYEVTIPAGTTATLYLPGVAGEEERIHELTPGYWRYEVAAVERWQVFAVSLKCYEGHPQ